MNKYFAVAKTLFKTQIVWRFDIAFNMLFTITKIIFATVVWSAVFGTRKEVSGFTLNTMLSYYVISSFLSRLEMSDGVSSEINARIRDGSFSKYMVIPSNTFLHFLAQTAGSAAFYSFFNLFAAFAWVLLFRIQFVFTTNILSALTAAVITLLGLVFMVQLNFFLGILTFRFQNIDPFLMIKNNLVAFVTGTMVPLVLLPQGVVTAMRLLPFYYVTYLPSMLFIGRNQNEALPGLLILTFWVLLFIPVNAITYKRLRVRYDGVGI